MQRIIHTIEAYQMIQPGMRVLAAVSGGADSVCLLVTLAGYRSQMDFSLSVVHVEHGLRGEESLEDAQYVRELCEALKVPFYLESVDAKRVAKERHLSVEEAARSLRYEAFYKVARKLRVGAQRERSGGDGALESDTRQRTYGARRYPAGAGKYHPAAFVFGKTGDRADSEKRGRELADRSDKPVL